MTNDTKLRYLDALAQHRLASSVRNEVEHFLRGLNELIPDNLLGIFDENELEVYNLYLSLSLSLLFLNIFHFICICYSYCCAVLVNTA